MSRPAVHAGRERTVLSSDDREQLTPVVETDRGHGEGTDLLTQLGRDRRVCLVDHANIPRRCSMAAQ